MSQIAWDKIHDEDRSWRTKLIGDLSLIYVIPRYIELFETYFKNTPKPLTFLELGAGNGELAWQIINRRFPFVNKYVVSEYFQKGVDWLNEKGLEAHLVNAENISFADRSFDVVLSFDVMHHVKHPSKMAYEMMRTANGKLLLTESNGFSIGRKIMELTPGHRKAGERSYTPSQYKSFFQHTGFQITCFEIHPFIFPIQLPKKWIHWSIALNRWIESVSFLRWQCSNVCIYLEYEQSPRRKHANPPGIGA